ncbi:MAG TPA: hypothetical protein VGS28_03040 [Candidatus Saccharimonadales bacterium]|nr:hypothetical protein [Candidatus Saccharimonadales bacterium]
MTSLQQDVLIEELVKRTLENGGLTFDFKNHEFVKPQDYWYFPKYPGLTAIVDQSELADSLNTFIAANQNLLLEDDVVFGTWVNPKTNKVYIDINTFNKDRAIALRIAKELSENQGREIVSMYNPIQEKTEYIDH